MNYKEFIEKVCVELKLYLDEEFRDAEIKFNSVKKIQNSSYDGISVVPVDCAVGISLDINVHYERFKSGENFDDIVKEIAENIYSALRDRPSINSIVEDYSVLKHRLFPQLISYNDNSEMLSNYPHKRIEDIAVVYRVSVLYAENSNDEASFILENGMFEKFGISLEELHEDAIIAASVKRPAFLKSIAEVLAEQTGIDGFGTDNQGLMYVAGVSNNLFGAAVILYKDFLKEASSKLGRSFYILPSSIHECLLIPQSEDIKATNLLYMVKEVNSNEVLPKDKLTDSVYYYDAETDNFSQVAGDSMMGKQNMLMR